MKPTADNKNKIKKGNGLHLYTNKYAQDEEKLASCRESADRFHHGYVVLELRDDSESTKKDVDRMLKNAKLKEVSEQQAKTKRLLCLLLARLSRFARGSLRKNSLVTKLINFFHASVLDAAPGQRKNSAEERGSQIHAGHYR